eukprot:Skav220958  [mRNA]  locus=scaffold1928:125988:143386:+ [translate_table: standard]
MGVSKHPRPVASPVRVSLTADRKAACAKAAKVAKKVACKVAKVIKTRGKGAGRVKVVIRSTNRGTKGKTGASGAGGAAVVKKALQLYQTLRLGEGLASDRRRRLSARLAAAREVARGAKRDALCAVLAALCCRLQKNWLAAYDDEVPARGYFAHALVDPSSCFRVAMKPGATLRQAVVLVVGGEQPVELARKVSLGAGGRTDAVGWYAHVIIGYR